MAGGDKKAKAKEAVKSAVPDSLSSNSYVDASCDCLAALLTDSLSAARKRASSSAYLQKYTVRRQVLI